MQCGNPTLTTHITSEFSRIDFDVEEEYICFYSSMYVYIVLIIDSGQDLIGVKASTLTPLAFWLLVLKQHDSYQLTSYNIICRSLKYLLQKLQNSL